MCIGLVKIIYMPVGKIRGSGKQPKAKRPTKGKKTVLEMWEGVWRSGAKLKIKVKKNYKEKFQKRNNYLKLALDD